MGFDNDYAESPNNGVPSKSACGVELPTNVPEDYAKFYNHGESLLLVERHY